MLSNHCFPLRPVLKINKLLGSIWGLFKVLICGAAGRKQGNSVEHGGTSITPVCEIIPYCVAKEEEEEGKRSFDWHNKSTVIFYSEQWVCTGIRDFSIS